MQPERHASVYGSERNGEACNDHRRERSKTGGKSVNLLPGRRGSFAAWWDNCLDSVPSSEAKTEAVTVSWTFAGQKSGIAQHIPKFTVGCPDVSFTVSAIELGVMSHPPWLPAPSAQSPTLGTTYVFGP